MVLQAPIVMGPFLHCYAAKSALQRGPVLLPMLRLGLGFRGLGVRGLEFRKGGFTQITDITVLGLRHLKKNEKEYGSQQMFNDPFVARCRA